MVKNPPANAGDVTDAGSIPGWGRSLGIGIGNPLQYSCLENSMERGLKSTRRWTPQRSLVDCSPRSHKESDTAEQLRKHAFITQTKI